jgi:hypothetical protein
LALGKLALLEGDPGLGKSLVALDLCARLTRGRAFPDGASGLQPSNVLILNGEDGPADTIRPRLEALDADLDRVFVRGLDGDDQALLRLPAQVDAFGHYLAQIQPKLVVIDPILAFLDPSIRPAADHSVRRALHPLAALAARYACTVVLIRHLNKCVGNAALYRGAWSIGFVAACRSAWVVAPDPDNADRRVMAQVKNNLAPPQASLVFAVPLPGEAGPLLRWLGTSQRGAAELLARPRTGNRPRDFARELLETFLLDRPRTSPEVWQFAREQKIKSMTLRRARKELKVRSVRCWLGGKRTCYWLLPGQEMPAQVPARV